MVNFRYFDICINHIRIVKFDISTICFKNSYIIFPHHFTREHVDRLLFRAVYNKVACDLQIGYWSAYGSSGSSDQN